MGNTVLKDYDVSKTQKASGGLHLYWKMFDAQHKVTQARVCVHVLEKASLQKKLRTEQFYQTIR